MIDRDMALLLDREQERQQDSPESIDLDALPVYDEGAPAPDPFAALPPGMVV